MTIYVHSKYREIQYESNIMPRENEFLNFPHFGTFKINKIVYRISDDNAEHNKVMWIDVFVDEEI